jgi:hypothetical protein
MMAKLPRTGLYVRLPDVELRWALRRAALDRRTDARQLLVDILTRWLHEAGYPVVSRDRGVRDD